MPRLQENQLNWIRLFIGIGDFDEIPQNVLQLCEKYQSIAFEHMQGRGYLEKKEILIILGNHFPKLVGLLPSEESETTGETIHVRLDGAVVEGQLLKKSAGRGKFYALVDGKEHLFTNFDRVKKEAEKEAA